MLREYDVADVVFAAEPVGDLASPVAGGTWGSVIQGAASVREEVAGAFRAHSGVRQERKPCESS